MKIGTPITDKPLAVISKINDIVPLRFNVMNNIFEVCEPFKAQRYAIVTDNGIIMIEENCNGKEQLIDII